MNDAAQTTHKIEAHHIARTVRIWSEYAGEAITLDDTLLGQPIGVPMTAFGSELACLRLHYRMKVGRVAYSANLGAWYYVNN